MLMKTYNVQSFFEHLWYRYGFARHFPPLILILLNTNTDLLIALHYF